MYKSILLVDDSSTSRMIMKRCFFIAGMEETVYYEAEDGLVALTTIEDHPVDLVVTDLNMPRMDGYTFLKKARIRWPSIPVIVISSIGKEHDDPRLKKENIKAIIRKPLSPAKLMEVLE